MHSSAKRSAYPASERLQTCGDGADHLSVLGDGVGVFYSNRDEVVPADSGVGEKKKSPVRRANILWLLFWSLDSICASRYLPAETV